MGKLKFFAGALLICFFLTSCYTSRVFHGNVTDNTPKIQVASRTNHFLLYGLIPIGANHQASNSIGDRVNYTTVTTHTFVNGLLSAITFGIYTPTTTRFYVPLSDF